LEAIQLLKKLGGSMTDSYLDEGFLLEKTPGMYQPKRIEKARILIANTPMDTDKIKVGLASPCLSVDGRPFIRSGFRLARQGRLGGQSGADGAGGEGEDEGQGQQDPVAQHQRVHQPPADLQLPRAAVRRRKRDGDRARRLRGDRATGARSGSVGWPP